MEGWIRYNVVAILYHLEIGINEIIPYEVCTPGSSLGCMLLQWNTISQGIFSSNNMVEYIQIFTHQSIF